MFQTTSYRTVVIAGLFVAAIGAGTALHLPALAAAGFARAVTPFTTCSGGAACIVGINNGSGPGVKGTSTSGDGMLGQTTFKSTGQKNGVSGILGQDTSASGAFDAGVKGTSTNGTGVYGISTNGNGLQAYSANAAAIFDENTGDGDGIQSIASNNDGTNTSTQNDSSFAGKGRSGVWGHDDSSDGGTLNNGVTGSSTNGTGVEGLSTNFVGVEAVGGGNANNDYVDPALSVTTVNSVYAMTVCNGTADVPCSAPNAAMLVDNSGNIDSFGGVYADLDFDTAGDYEKDGSCILGCARTRDGRHRTAVRQYLPSITVPSIEDDGEAQLVDGDARVEISPDFANVIDKHAGYLVFITPEGDTNGLYVERKDAAGFEVRENRGGRSSVAFEYRIVARPFGDPGSRLPMVVTGMPLRSPQKR